MLSTKSLVKYKMKANQINWQQQLQNKYKSILKTIHLSFRLKINKRKIITECVN